MENETTNMITPQTIEALQLSKLNCEAEAFTNGAIQACELITKEPDYALLTELHDSAKAWRKGEDNYRLDYIDFPGDSSSALNGVVINGFFEAVMLIHIQLRDSLEVQS